MKIKKVDDKPMVIHTKEKAKIHAHEPKGAKIKGSNIYTVERGPKVHDAKANEMDKKASAKLMLQKSAGESVLIERVPFINRRLRIRVFLGLSVTSESQELPSRPRTPIFTLQEEQEHLQPGL